MKRLMYILCEQNDSVSVKRKIRNDISMYNIILTNDITTYPRLVGLELTKLLLRFSTVGGLEIDAGGKHEHGG